MNVIRSQELFPWQRVEKHFLDFMKSD